jgi:hypothetical protein
MSTLIADVLFIGCVAAFIIGVVMSAAVLLAG